MNTNNQPIRIRLYSVDYAHDHPEDLDRLTADFWRSINAKFDGESRIVQEARLPEGAKVAAVGIVGGLIIEQFVTRSVDHVVSILFNFVKEWLEEKRNQGDLRAKIQVGNQFVDLSSAMQKSDIEAEVRRLGINAANNVSEGKRLALIVGNTQYTDSKLTRLNAPQADVSELAEALSDANIGGFHDVQILLDESSSQIKQRIELLYRGRSRDDLLFLYFSGHGIKDEQGNLYLATSDTQHDFARSTGISANFIRESMANSYSRRKVLVLDCCYSGAFVQGAKSTAALGSRINASQLFRSNGYGQVVVTASDTMQYAWEGNKIIGNTDNSLFTHYLIEGLRTGKADTDKDGHVSITELYSYAYDKVIGRQTPNISSTEMEGKIIIARNPRPVARPDLLPSGLQEALNSAQVWQREGAIIELGRLINGDNLVLANTAHYYLKKLAEDDSRKVSLAAQQALARVGRGEQPSHQTLVRQPAPSRLSQTQRVPESETILKAAESKNNPRKLSPNTSGSGKFAEIPDEIKGKWNWGAFLLGFVWGIGNSTWISFALFIPYVNFIFPFVLGIKGNEWAWRNKQWESVAHFQKVQKRWKKWSFILTAMAVLFFLFVTFIFAISGY